MRLSIFATIIVLAAPVVAAQIPGSPEAALKRFGLYGRLAPDCSVPLEPRYQKQKNGVTDQVRFRTSLDGKVEYTSFSLISTVQTGVPRMTGWSPMYHTVNAVKQIGPGEIELSVTRDPIGKLDIVWEKKDGKLRLKSSRNAEGVYGVRDHVGANGREYQWLSVCGEG